MTFSKGQLWTNSTFQIAGISLRAFQLIKWISPLLTKERVLRLREAVEHRTYNVAPVLENIYDRGNVSAVMRSAEAFGFVNFHIIERPDARFKTANRVSQGTEKWLNIQKHSSTPEAVSCLRENGYQILATHLGASMDIDRVDFSRPTAIVLGNEKDGVSDELVQMADGVFKVPMHGLAQSFNISVAAAVIFYHALKERQRLYGASGDLTDLQREVLLANYFLRSLDDPERTVTRLARDHNLQSGER